MKKTKLLLAFFCLLLLFTTYSCQVEELDPTPTAITDNGTSKKINPLFLTHKFSDNKIKPLWKSAITFDNVDAVEVNFSIDKKFYRPLSENKKVVGRQRILLTFDKEGKVKETFIEYIPSNNFSGDIKKINSGNFKNQFEGKVTFRNPNKEIKIARIISNAKIIQKTTLTKTKPLGNVTTSKTSGENCTTNYECTTYSLGFQDPALGEVFVDAQNECWWETICYNDPYLDTNPETPAEIDPYSCDVNPGAPWCNGNGGGQDPEENDNPPSCRAFDYSNVSSNWQTAATKNIVALIGYYDVATGDYDVASVLFPQPIYFEMPINSESNGGYISSGRAAEITASALETAIGRAKYYFLSTSASSSQVQAKLWEYIRDEMNNGTHVVGGKASFTPPSNFKGQIIDYKSYWFLPDDCN